jgi:hypothetical protein
VPLRNYNDLKPPRLRSPLPERPQQLPHRDPDASFANQIVNLHPESIGDPEQDGERGIALAALDFLQRVFVDASQLRDHTPG